MSNDSGLDGLQKKTTFREWANYFKMLGEIPANTFFVDENGISWKSAVYPGTTLKPIYLTSNKQEHGHRVWSLWGKKFRKIQLNGQNRETVNLIDTDGKAVCCMFARLVCASFNGMPAHYEGLDVQHLDEDMHNNDASNLEWTTKEVNNNTKEHRENIAKEHIGRKKQKVVFEIDNKGNVIDSWPSIKAAHEETGVSTCSIKLGGAYGRSFRVFAVKISDIA